jgi:opacity protein-like surface antigen
MKSYLIVIATLATIAIPSLGTTAEGKPGPYVSAFLGTTFTQNTTVSGFDRGTAYSDRATFDPGIYIGGTGGYDFGFLRLEAELSYRNAPFDTITFSDTTRFNNVNGDLDVYATMFNVFFDAHNSTPVTPYVGGGIGFATLHLSNTFVNSPSFFGGLYQDSSDTVFASQVGAGLDIALNNRFSLDVGYRYFITERANLGSNLISSNLKFESHNMMVGFKAKF